MSLFIKKYKTSYGKTHCSIVDGYRVNGKIKHKTIKKYGYLEDLEKQFDDPFEFLNSELANLKKEIAEYNEIKKLITDEIELIELMSEAEFNDYIDNLDKVILDIKEKVSSFEIKALLSGEYDDDNCFLEIHPGAGGTEVAFIRDFQPDMCGIGPFIPHHATPFGEEPAGTLEQTVYLLSIIRLLVPSVLLPATTALGTIDPVGREKGILAGANVVMPNLSPVAVRKKYELYENKICTGEESAQCRGCLAGRMASIGFEIVTDRGDVKRTQAACRKQTVGK